MSDLTAVEKRKLERLLGMETGYVLDFSNRTFADFIRDSTGRNIYDSYYDNGSGSKANRLRAFWQKESNVVVGKLMTDILDYSEATGGQAEMCRLIVARLLHYAGQGHQGQAGSEQKEQSAQALRRSQELRQLQDEFFQLADDPDRSRAGLALV